MFVLFSSFPDLLSLYFIAVTTNKVGIVYCYYGRCDVFQVKVSAFFYDQISPFDKIN